MITVTKGRKTKTKAPRLTTRVRKRLKESGVEPKYSTPSGLTYAQLEQDWHELTEGNIRLAKELMALKDATGIRGYQEQEKRLKEMERQIKDGVLVWSADLILAYKQTFRNALALLEQHFTGSAKLSREANHELTKTMMQWAFLPFREKLSRYGA
jgi:hypothetical protein